MKTAKSFAWLFGILGGALMVFSIGLCLVSLNTTAAMDQAPEGAVECAEQLMEAVASGDFTGASRYFYGQPDLGTDRGPGEMEGVMIYDAFLDSISYEWNGAFYAAGAGIARDVAVTYLEIPSVTEQLGQRAQALLTARVEAAADLTELYDENYHLREDLVADVLREAVVRGLAEDARRVTKDLTLTMIQRDGQWYAVLDPALLQVLSGQA